MVNTHTGIDDVPSVWRSCERVNPAPFLSSRRNPEFCMGAPSAAAQLLHGFSLLEVPASTKLVLHGPASTQPLPARLPRPVSPLMKSFAPPSASPVLVIEESPSPGCEYLVSKPALHISCARLPRGSGAVQCTTMGNPPPAPANGLSQAAQLCKGRGERMLPLRLKG